MSTTELREEAKSMIDEMSPSDLKLVREFLAFVSVRKTNAATRELLAIPGFAESYQRGMRDIAAGHVTPVSKLRRKK